MQTATAHFFDDDVMLGFMTSRERKQENRKRKSQLRRATKKIDVDQELNPRINVKRIHPLTENQELTFEAYEDGKNLLLHGVAGTGKTFLALGLSLQAVADGKTPKPIVILRSVVPSRDMGFLPGKIEEKYAVYEEPYRGLCHELTGKPSAYNYLKDRGFIQFSTTSHLRGLTFRENTIIIDECQNMNFGELDTIMTRAGDNCRMIFCGDFRQTDLQRDQERSGLDKFMKVLHKMPSFASIEFTRDDIVRSGLVKEYITTKLDMGYV